RPLALTSVPMSMCIITRSVSAADRCGAKPARSSRALLASMRCLAFALGSLRISLSTSGAATTCSCAFSRFAAPFLILLTFSASTISTKRSSAPMLSQTASSKRHLFLTACSEQMPSAYLAKSAISSSFSRRVWEATEAIATLSSQLCTRAPTLYHESEPQGTSAVDIFKRLNRGKPPPEEKAKRQPKELAEALLGWLERWPKPTVSSRDIRIWGPKALHDRERAIRSAEILVAHGRLQPTPKPRVWEIVRDPLIPSSRP